VTADVLVIGAGIAGLTTAIAAAESGARVLVVEKLGEPGGSTVLSGGSFTFAGTEQQAAEGIEDSGEILRQDLIEVSQGRGRKELLDAYVAHDLDAYHWLVGLGVTFGPIQAAAGQSVPRAHPADPRAVMRLLAGRVAEIPAIELRMSSPARLLTVDPATGRVDGALVEGPDGSSTHERAGAVVLASGGFSRNEALLDQYVPGQAGALHLGGAGSEGDGLRMAQKLGADVLDLPFIKGTFGSTPGAQAHEHTTCIAVYKGAIAVNQRGERFVDESQSYKLLGDACLAQPGAVAYQILDRRIFENDIAGYPMFDFHLRLREGRLLQADSLAELAALIDVPADALERTVADYNERVRTDTPDPLGRSHLTHRFGDLVEITEPPFFAYPSTSAIVATYAGVATTAEARVLDVFGEVIPGLFAVGEVMGGFHGAAYMTGTSLGKAAVFGRIAGAAAARDAAERASRDAA
jgi:fumarate reductase flavoprotein subunit